MKNQNKFYLYITYAACIIISLSTSACFDSANQFEPGWSDEDYEIAIPLFNSDISVGKLKNVS